MGHRLYHNSKQSDLAKLAISSVEDGISYALDCTIGVCKQKQRELSETCELLSNNTYTMAKSTCSTIHGQVNHAIGYFHPGYWDVHNKNILFNINNYVKDRVGNVFNSGSITVHTPIYEEIDDWQLI